MKIIILTGLLYGHAPYHLSEILSQNNIEVVMVVFSEGKIKNKWKHYKNKLKKVFKIGIFGTVNGMRLRKWYNEDFYKHFPLLNLEDICKENKIPFERVPSVNCEKTVELFKQSDAELGLSVGNGYIGKKIFSICKYGMINIHDELLPEYQNAQSIIWQLYNGSTETGFTIHKIDNRIDTGAILFKEKLSIEFKETLAETVSFNYAKLLKQSSIALIKVLNDFENYFNNAKPQPKGNSFTTPTFSQFKKIKKQFKKLKAKVN